MVAGGRPKTICRDRDRGCDRDCSRGRGCNCGCNCGLIAIVEHVGGGRGGEGAGCGSEALLLEIVAVLWRSRSVSL